MPEGVVFEQKGLHEVRTIRLLPFKSIPLSAQGVVKPDLSLEVKSPVDSRVEWVHPSLREGGVFRKGEVMLKLGSGTFEALQAQRKLELEQARLDYSNDRIEAIKSVKKYDAGKDADGAESDLVMRLPGLRLSDAKINACKAGLKAVQEFLDSTEVKAPYDCVVTGLSAGLYSPVQTGDVLCSIVSSADRKVVMNIPLAALNMMSVSGGRIADYLVTVTNAGLSGGKWLGTVRYAGRYRHQDNTVELVAGLPAVNGSVCLPAELPVSVVIDIELPRPCYMVPSHSFADASHIWVIDRDYKLAKRKVILEGQLGGIIYVSSDEVVD